MPEVTSVSVPPIYAHELKDKLVQLKEEYTYDACALSDIGNDAGFAVAAGADAIANIGSSATKASKTGSLKLLCRFFGRPGVQRGLAITGLVLGIISIPATLVYLHDSASDLKDAVKDKDPEFIFDHAVDVVSSVAALGTISTGIIAAVSVLGRISGGAVRALPILNLVLSIIAGVSAVKSGINAKQIYSNRKLLNEVTTHCDKDKRFEIVREYLRGLDERRLNKHFYADKAWLLNILNKVQDDDRVTQERALYLLNYVNSMAWKYQACTTVSSSLWFAGGIAAFCPDGGTAAIGIFVPAAIGSFVADVYCWVKWRKFRHKMNHLHTPPNVQTIGKVHTFLKGVARAIWGGQSHQKGHAASRSYPSHSVNGHFARS